MAIVIGLAGCAWTGIDTQTTPFYAGEKYEKLAVMVDVSNAGLARDAERRFVSELSGYGVEAIEYSTLMPSTIDYSMEERIDALERAGVDAVLYAACTGAGSSSHYVPRTSTTSGRVNPYTGQVSATTRTYGGYSMSKPWASFTVELLSMSTGDVVWIGYSETSGNAYAGSKTVLRSLADKAAGQLVKDGLVGSRKHVGLKTRK